MQILRTITLIYISTDPGLYCGSSQKLPASLSVTLEDYCEVANNLAENLWVLPQHMSRKLKERLLYCSTWLFVELSLLHDWKYILG